MIHQKIHPRHRVGDQDLITVGMVVVAAVRNLREEIHDANDSNKINKYCININTIFINSQQCTLLHGTLVKKIIRPMVFRMYYFPAKQSDL